MQMGRFFRNRAGIFPTVVILLSAAIFLTAEWLGAMLTPETSGGDVAGRADVVTIDEMKVFRELERPPVTFLHGLHTAALVKKDRDCRTCHEQEKNGLSTKFKRLEDGDRQSVMDTYHDNCISCHRQTRSAGEKSGPVVCGQCHTPKPAVASSRKPFGFDKSLHYRHAKALDNKCQQCHHVYDENAKKLIYIKGKEATCRYCHKKEKEENRISADQAFHFVCIGCHRQRVAKKMDAGPKECIGCHSAEQQAAIAKVDPVPRMKMDQPDTVFVKTASDNLAEQQLPPPGMRRVPFDHKAHEGTAQSCRVCHHKALAACATCHTLGGDEKGQQVKLETAMHQLQSQRSCQGCHAAVKQTSNCAGCHGTHKAQVSQNVATCTKCHLGPLPGDQSTVSSALSKAASLLASVKEMLPKTVSDNQIPEKVTIAGLTKDYETVEFPHRRIVHALMKDVAASRLAKSFHNNAATLCQGCHHNSPAQQKPPACNSCHGKSFTADNPLKPGLMGAYHQQCMTCHEAMGIKKPASRDCIACHKKRDVS